MKDKKYDLFHYPGFILKSSDNLLNFGWIIFFLKNRQRVPFLRGLITEEVQIRYAPCAPEHAKITVFGLQLRKLFNEVQKLHSAIFPT